jgi:acetyl-CoA acetyltransferase
MAEAPPVAARSALQQADLSFDDMDAIKTHNPFAVNDIVFARETGVSPKDFNNFGCSLIWGHPQAPTAMRSIIELIEELVLRGGGRGLFTGCAAGDSAMALVMAVDNRQKE